MDVKQAVTMAKQYVSELFSEEKPTNLGLEEVEFDSSVGEWTVTVGFSRPWDEPASPVSMAGLIRATQLAKRDYKIVRIDDVSGEVRSIKARELKAAA